MKHATTPPPAPTLPFDAPHAPDFDGETYDRTLDRVRLGEQAIRVFTLMRDGVWRTLAEIKARTNDPEASVSARLRDFKKKRFGAHTVERRRRHGNTGLYEYQLRPNPQVRMDELDPALATPAEGRPTVLNRTRALIPILAACSVLVTACSPLNPSSGAASNSSTSAKAPKSAAAATVRQTWQVYDPSVTNPGAWDFAERTAVVKVQYVDPSTGATVRLEKQVGNTATAWFDLPASLTYVYAWAKDDANGLCWHWFGEGYSQKNGVMLEGDPWPRFYLYGVPHRGSDIFYLYLTPCAAAAQAN